MDIALGAGVAATTLAATAARPFVTAAAGAVRLGARVSGGRPHTGLARRLADRGGALREGLERAAAEVVRWVLPLAVERALAAVDVTDLVRAHVDLDALAKILDVDAVVARVDLDAAVARVDLDAVVSRVDLDAVASRLDLDARDLPGRPRRRRLPARPGRDHRPGRPRPGGVPGRPGRDRARGWTRTRSWPGWTSRRRSAGSTSRAIARQVIEAIDLAEILRESAGVVSSQAARSVRTEGMHADESVARFFDRVLRRPHPGGAVTP